MSREDMLVELVDADGLARGSATVARAHAAPGLLHRAFSVLLLDAGGRLLLQQRSAAKTRFALHWANACCGHPAPGESMVVAATRRLSAELGVRDVPLTPIGVYLYQAADPASGVVEHEYDHVLVGRVDSGVPVDPDPAEVAALRWLPPAQLEHELAETDPTAPWLAGVVSVWKSASRPA